MEVPDHDCGKNCEKSVANPVESGMGPTEVLLFIFFASKSTDWSNQRLCLATQHLLKGGETRKSNKKDQ